MESLEQQIKEKLVEVLELDTDPSEIEDTTSLLGSEGLGIDSVDVLEVVAMLQMDFGVEIRDQDQAREVLVNVRTMADFVRKSR